MASTPVKVCRMCQRVFRCEDDFFTDTHRWRLGYKNELFFDCSCNSTLMLPVGTYDWYHPSKLLRPDAKAVFNRLASWELIPKIPSAVYTLQDVVRDPESSSHDIVHAIKLEPVLAAELLKMANMSKSSTSGEITSLEHAVVFIGRRVLSDMLLAVSLRQFSFSTKFYSAKLFWTEAFAAAIVAEKLAQYLRAQRLIGKGAIAIEPDRAYIGACLTNVGKVVAASCFSDEMDRVYQLCLNKQINWRTAEAQIKAPSHEILGEIAGVLWGLPDFVATSAGCHHSLRTPDYLTEEQVTFEAIITLANQLAHWLLMQRYRVEPDLLIQAAEKLSIPMSALEQMVQECAPQRERIYGFVV